MPPSRPCHRWAWLSIVLSACLPPSGRAQLAEIDPAVYLIDSVAVTVECDPAKWCISPAHEFRLRKQFGMKPPLELRLTAYPPPAHGVSIVLLLVDSTGVSGITLWKGQMKTVPMVIYPEWNEKREQIPPGRFVVKVLVDPPGEPAASTYEFFVIKPQ